MKTYISLLRGINVSGQKKVNMIQLQNLYQSLGFQNIKTYIQSGNVIFQSSPPPSSQLLQQKIKQQFGFEVPVILRSIEDWENIIKHNPFTKEDLTKVHIVFLSETAQKYSKDELEKAKNPSEEFFIHNKEIYLYCPNGYGKTKLSNTFLEHKLNLTATTRNWNTIKNLFELAKM